MESEETIPTVTSICGRTFEFTEIQTMVPASNAAFLFIPREGGKFFTYDGTALKRYSAFLDLREANRVAEVERNASMIGQTEE